MTTGLDGLQIPFAKAYDDEPEFLYTTMVFQQSSAPTGWVKVIDYDDCTLRVTNGVTTGFNTTANPFNTVFSSKSFGSSTIAFNFNLNNFVTTINEMRNHNHTVSIDSAATASAGAPSAFSVAPSPGGFLAGPKITTTTTINPAGSSAPLGHGHTLNKSLSISTSPNNLNLGISYVDAILAKRY